MPQATTFFYPDLSTFWFFSSSLRALKSYTFPGYTRVIVDNTLFRLGDFVADVLHEDVVQLSQCQRDAWIALRLRRCRYRTKHTRGGEVRSSDGLTTGQVGPAGPQPPPNFKCRKIQDNLFTRIYFINHNNWSFSSVHIVANCCDLFLDRQPKRPSFFSNYKKRG